ncbi:selenium binding protein [Dictyocaulus viviparus]|uniref:Selenium binding protein n=1 Tax=Dictyocaulus viviparus TaxID=29172 RepID=A0A0D8XJZ2_DICVI|nr:selenium binding protein [Dictyocaulus viviparus]
MSCKKTQCGGPGYACPKEALKAPKEKVIFVTCPHTNPEVGHDKLVAVDVDSNSNTFCQVLSSVTFPNKGDEVHHSGWNACSSCHNNPSAKRTHIILPCLNSDRIYIVNVEDVYNIFLEKTVEREQLSRYNVSTPHTTHCLADGNIMISTMGNNSGDHEEDMANVFIYSIPIGNFILLDGKTFEPKGCWLDSNTTLPFNYDFWYQPRCDVMISTEWGTPNVIKKGFDLKHIAEGYYGRSVHIFKWSTRQKLQTIDLPEPEGAIPLEVRFLHEPTSPFAFVGTALGSSLFLLHPENEDSNRYAAKCVVKIPPKKVEGWILPEMPSLITDILISMDDRFYTFPTGFMIFLGGSIHTESGVKIIHDDEMKDAPPPRYVKGNLIEGGPQMLQLSLDGRRLYVTTSLYRQWDAQFYPKLLKSGAVMMRVNVSDDGTMTLDENFLVNFGSMEAGPYLGHEMRYPGGDCTSDIWI